MKNNVTFVDPQALKPYKHNTKAHNKAQIDNFDRRFFYEKTMQMAAHEKFMHCSYLYFKNKHFYPALCSYSAA